MRKKSTKIDYKKLGQMGGKKNAKKAGRTKAERSAYFSNLSSMRKVKRGRNSKPQE